jgi:glutamine cyclotransferase
VRLGLGRPSRPGGRLRTRGSAPPRRAGVVGFWVLLCAALAAGQNAPVRSYKVIATYPHDPKAFTEGLQYINGVLYEGTGLNGSSSIRKVDLTTGAILKVRPISDFYFGEGITVLGNRLYELTYKNGAAFVYDAATFQTLDTLHYPGEGWALTYDGKRLIMSDGSSALRFLEPATFRELGRLPVRDGVTPITNLNELEFIDGEIWANIWQTDRVARIDPRSGQVNSWVDFRGLLKQSDRTPETDVLNGIAYDAQRKRIFVTGKRWPKLFQIQVVEPPKTASSKAASK